MQETASSTREDLDISEIFENFKIIKMCEHKSEVNVKYNSSNFFKFQMCYDCWGMEEHHTISKDTIQVIRPKQLDITYAECLKCKSDMSSCVCYNQQKII